MERLREIVTEADIGKLTHARVSIVPLAPVRFTHAEFQMAINLSQELNPNSGVKTADLIFIDCIFLYQMDLGDWKSAGNIRFEKCQFNEDVSFATMSNIVLDAGCHFCKELKISDASTLTELGNFSIFGQLKARLGGQNLKLTNINTDTIITDQALHIDSACSKFHLVNCSFGKIYINSENGNQSHIGVHGCRAERISIGAYYANCTVTLTESTLKRISISGPTDGKISFDITSCKDIKVLQLGMSTIGKAEISYCSFRTLEISESIAPADELTIENTEVFNLIFQRLTNNGSISLRGLTVPFKGMLTMIASNLGKTEFINCDFFQATLEFENSRLSEVFLPETDFPTHVVQEKMINYNQAQLAFGQLNKVFDKQGDTVRALEYQAREIEAHYHNIPSFWHQKAPYIHFTKLNLGLNRLSNNFGRDWGRGVVFALGAGLICFTGLVWTTKEYSLHGHWHFDLRLIASFARFMNPLRFFDLETLFTQNSKEPYVKLTWGSYVMDFLGRIVIAYGYYQTIQAFRRFGRK